MLKCPVSVFDISADLTFRGLTAIFLAIQVL